MKNQDVISAISDLLNINLHDEYHHHLHRCFDEFYRTKAFALIHKYSKNEIDNNLTTHVSAQANVNQLDQKILEHEIKKEKRDINKFIKYYLSLPEVNDSSSALNKKIKKYFQTSFPGDINKQQAKLLKLFEEELKKTNNLFHDLCQQYEKEIQEEHLKYNLNLTSITYGDWAFVLSRASSLPFYFHDYLNKEYWKIFSTQFNSCLKDYIKSPTRVKYKKHFNKFSIEYFKQYKSSSDLSVSSKNAILKDKVKFKLWTTVGSTQITQWIQDVDLISEKGCVHIKNYRLVTKTGKYQNYSMPNVPADQIPSTHQIGSVLVKNQNEPSKTNLKFPFEFYQEITGKEESKMLVDLSNEFGIKEEKPFDKVELDGRRNWVQVSINKNEYSDTSHCKYYPFNFKKNKGTTVLGYVKYDLNTCDYLPISHWKKHGESRTFDFNIPFENDSGKSTLFNQNLIYEHQQAGILLTPKLPLAMGMHKKDSFSYVFTSWFGGIDNVKNIEWNTLTNRTVFYMLGYIDNKEKKNEYTLAYEVFRELSPLVKNLVFIDFQYMLNDNDNEPKIKIFRKKEMNCDSFEQQAVSILDIKQEIIIPEQDQYRGPIKAKRASDIRKIKPRKTLCSPVFLDKSITLLYAKTSVGKTWLALTLCHVIAAGGRIFNLWHVPKAVSTLYIDSEMEKASFRTRIEIIQKMNFGTAGQHIKSNMAKNFTFILKDDKRFKLSRDEFLEEVVKYVKKNKIKFLVLDNISSFMEHNDSAGAWEELNTWLNMLHDAGCASLLIHHSNKKDEQRGSSAKTNTVDNVIRLTEKEPSSDTVDLAMSIEIEKGRDLYNFSKKGFDVELVLDEKAPRWHLAENPDNDKEKTTKIENDILKVLINKHKKIDFISDYLGWGLTKTKERILTCRAQIKQEKEKEKKAEENLKQEKVSPGTSLPNLNDIKPDDLMVLLGNSLKILMNHTE